MSDTILLNAHIPTLDPAYPDGYATAIVLRDGKTLGLGSDEKILKSRRPHTEVIDLGGRLVLPGLIDAHCHFSMWSLSRREIHAEQPAKAIVLDAVRQRAAATPPGTWITGHGWLQDHWDGIFPTAADLDAVAPHHPVYLRAKSGHAAWVNTAALTLAHLTASTPDPDGGKVVRQPDGSPSGILLETAMDLVGHLRPDPTPAEWDDIIKSGIAEAHRLGLTGVHCFDGATAFQAYQRLHQRGDLTLRITKTIPVYLVEHALALGIRSGLGDDFLRLGNVKVFMDGALGPRTAAMLAPYEGEPDNLGIVVTDKETLYEVATKASAAGLAMTVHAIGDRANHDTLDVFAALRTEESARGETPTQRRHRLEHVQLLHPDDLTRPAALNVIASMQPLHATSDMPTAERYWGDRHPYGYTFKTQLDSGAPLAFGSDAPIEVINPFTGIHAAVTSRRPDGTPGPHGWHPDQRLTVAEAVRAYTTGPAYAGYMETRQGQLASGYLADLIVLDRDIFTIDPMDIVNTQVVATLVNGNFVHRTI